MAALGRKLASFVWWTYPRGGLEYDVMVGLILAFIFLTPRSFFRDQPRGHVSPAGGFAALWRPAPVEAAQDPPPTAAEVEAALDQSAPNVHSVSAAVARSLYDAITNSTESHSGEFYYQKTKSGPEMAIDFTDPPPPEIFVIKGQRYWDVKPALHAGDSFSAGGHSGMVNELLALGFGGTGDALAASYKVQVAGREPLGGAPTVHLSLVPADPAILRTYPRIELWLDPGHDWVAVQQKLWQDARDFALVRYTAVQVNPALPDARFSTDFPGVKITRH